MNFTVDVNIKASPELMEVLRSLVGAPKAAAPVMVVEQVPTAQPAQPPAAVPTAQPAQPPAAVPAAPAPAPAPTPTTAEQPVEAVPTTAQTYTMEQLAVAATQLVDAGRRDELVCLLGHFGVQALTQLPKEQYGDFATALRQMGAKI